MTAREHAMRASHLLEGIVDDDDVSTEARLLAIDVASAHAQTAIALQATEPPTQPMASGLRWGRR